MWIVVILAADYKPSDTKQVIVAAEMMLNCLGETDTISFEGAWPPCREGYEQEL